MLRDKTSAIAYFFKQYDGGVTRIRELQKFAKELLAWWKICMWKKDVTVQKGGVRNQLQF